MNRQVALGVLHGRGVVALIIIGLIIYASFPFIFFLLLVLHELKLAIIHIDTLSYIIITAIAQSENTLLDQLSGILLPAFGAFSAFLLTADRQRPIGLLVFISGLLGVLIIISFLGAAIVKVSTFADVLAGGGDADVVPRLSEYFTRIQDQSFVFLLMILGIEGAKSAALTAKTSDDNQSNREATASKD